MRNADSADEKSQGVLPYIVRHVINEFIKKGKNGLRKYSGDRSDDDSNKDN
jgi:hypothetical protein